MDGGGVSGGKGGVTYCVWGGVCGTRPGVNSPTKHQRKVLIKHQVNSRKSTSSCSDWATCFILVHCTSHIVHPNTILLHRALCFFFFKNTLNLFSFSILYSSTIKCSSVLSLRLSDFLSDPHELRGSCCSDN